MTSHRVETRASPTVPRDRPRPMLLVLEDDPSARDLLTELGGDAGWEVRLAGTALSLRRALEDRLPDLLIIDDDAGDGRGGDLARELRGARRTRDLRIMILTAAQHGRRDQLATLASVIPKPFDLADLERRLARVDGETHRRRQTERQAS